MEPEFPDLVQRLQCTEGISYKQWGEAKNRKFILENAHKEIAQAYGFEPCKIEFTMNLPRGVTGTYRDGTITIREDLLEARNPERPIRTLAHESRHAYQYHAIYRLVDPPAERRNQIEKWRENWKHYISSRTVLEVYEDQAVEIDASAFADTLVDEVYKIHQIEKKARR
jgi:hypothetical protein